MEFVWGRREKGWRVAGAERTRCGKEGRKEGRDARCAPRRSSRLLCFLERQTALWKPGGDLKGLPPPHFQPRPHLWSLLRETALAKTGPQDPEGYRATPYSDEKVGKELTSVELPLVPTGLSTRQVGVETVSQAEWEPVLGGSEQRPDTFPAQVCVCVCTRGSHVTVHA